MAGDEEIVAPDDAPVAEPETAEQPEITVTVSGLPPSVSTGGPTSTPDVAPVALAAGAALEAAHSAQTVAENAVALLQSQIADLQARLSTAETQLAAQQAATAVVATVVATEVAQEAASDAEDEESEPAETSETPIELSEGVEANGGGSEPGTHAGDQPQGSGGEAEETPGTGSTENPTGRAGRFKRGRR